MTSLVEVIKFLLGAAILIVALFEDQPQPAIVVIALVLMGVITADQLWQWMRR